MVTRTEANNFQGFQPIYNYSPSIAPQQIAFAEETALRGRCAFRRVNPVFLAWGQELLDRQIDLGSDFKKWLTYYFPDAAREAKKALAIASLARRLPQYAERMMGWGLSALVALSKLADNLIIHVLTSGSKWTIKAIKELLRPALDREKVATDEDWQQLVWEKYWVSASDRPMLRNYAADLAQQQASPEKVAHILATLERYPEVLKFKTSRRQNRAAIATYNLSKEDERKLAQLAEVRGMTPNKLIAQLLETAPEFNIQEAKSNPTPSVEETLEEYRAQIAQMQKQLAQMAAEKESLQQPSVTVETTPATAKTAATETPAPIELVEATAREIDAVAGGIARSIDVRSALAEVGESALFLVQRLVKILKQSSAGKNSDWEEDFAIYESQEIDNWEPA